MSLLLLLSVKAPVCLHNNAASMLPPSILLEMETPFMFE